MRSLILLLSLVAPAGAQAHGWSVDGAGDVNNDGFDDVIVGAPYQVGARGEAGRVSLYLGSSSGPSLTPDWVVDGYQAGSRFGSSVAGVGDINGDGFDDVVVGAPHFDVRKQPREAMVGFPHQRDEGDHGRIYVFRGTPSGLTNSPVFVTSGVERNEHFGRSLSGGDVNGDGFADIVVGATGTQGNNGAVFVFHGRAIGPHPYPSTIVFNDRPNSAFGIAIDASGDANGDGYDDLLVGAEDGGSFGFGAAKAYAGTSDGLLSNPFWVHDGLTLFAIGEPNFGASVAWVDRDNDGFDEALVGDPNYDDIEFMGASNEDVGAVFGFAGSAAGPGDTPILVVEGTVAGGHLGASVARVDNVNGDMLQDMVAGGPQSGLDDGQAVVVHGIAGGTWGGTLQTNLSGQYPGGRFGFMVASAGDVNGDGLDDVVVGAPYNLEGGATGRVRVFNGRPAGVSNGSYWTLDQ